MKLSLKAKGPLFLLGSIILTGCHTPEANPSAAQANMGYVDFYSADDTDLAWEIKQIDQTTSKSRILYSEFKPVPGTTLRLSVPPGNYQFEVWFRNRVTEGPQTVPASVEDGKVTPVRVSLTAAGSASIHNKVYGFRPSSKGYGRGTKITSQDTEVARIEAAAELSQSYKPKEQMPYFRPAPQ